MLQTIRDRAHGWIAWVIVFLISVPFALWGIQSYLGIGGEPVAAKVNGIEITQRDLDRRVQQARMRLREQFGASYDTTQFDDKQLRRDVLDTMIRETLLVDVSSRLGLRVSDQELRGQILSEPAFQSAGHFDPASYERTLQLQGMSPAMFEAQLRQRLIGTQLARAVVDSELVTSAEREAFLRLSGQKRAIDWMRIPASRFLDETPVDEADVLAYYEANAARFQTPEQVKLDYLVLDVDALANKTEISEEELRHAYESDQSRFGQPERRQVRHVLLPIPPGADEAASAAVLAEIEAVRKRIEGGEPFDQVAREVSKDPGSAAQGGALGEIERGLMDPAFDEAAFSLQPGELSQPVKTRFGYHLIEVQSVNPASIKPFEEVRDQLRAEVARQRAEGLFYDMGERLANVVYESSDSLEPAAEELGLSIQHSDWVGREGGEGLLASPKVTAAAFSEEVLNERRNSDLIEPEKDVLQAVVVRVVDHREAATLPLDEVRDDIVAALRQERARKAAAAAAAAAAEKLKGGADWASVAAGDQVEDPGLVGRSDPDLPVPVREVAFTLPVLTEGQASIGTATFDDGDAAVVRVTRVDPGEAAPAPEQGPDQARSTLGRLMGREAYDAVLEDMERRADVERKPMTSPSEG